MNLEPQVQNIDVENIIPNRFQPRLTFDETALKELALSIKEHGIIQPLVLRKLTSDKYEIIAGERRYKAAQIAGFKTVPAIIANLDDNKSAEIALVENLQRKNLSAIEEAKSYKKLLDRGYLTQEQLAERMGLSQSAIANKIRLLNLSEEAQDALMNEKISERHARSLLQLKDHDKQVDMLNKIINERLTVRQLDAEIKKLLDSEIESFTLDNDIPSSLDNNDNLETFELTKETNDTKDEENTEFVTNEEDDEDAIAKLILEAQKELKEKYEIFDIPTAEEAQEDIEVEEVVEKEKIESGNLESAINAVKNIEEEIKSAGFKIETEDYDFEDLYQIIIKIEK